MATFRLQPPAPFSFKSPDEWPRWKKRFEQFRAASGLNEEAGEKQVSTLLYAMGEDAEDTLASMNPSADQRKDYGEVIKKFDDFFKVRKNVIFERARFNKRCQGSDESVEQFITSLYSLADGCDYGEFRETMIRDRIVVGIRDKVLSESLQMDAKLTLDDAKRRARQREAVSGQQGVIQDKSSDVKVEHIKGKKNPPPKPGARYRSRAVESRGQPKDNGRSSPARCTRCGRGKHARHECPAREAVCHLCKKRGHFQAQCFHAARNKQQSSSKVGAVTGSDEEDLIYLNTIVTVDAINGSTWLDKITINNTETVFKIDTGAEVTVITEEVLKSLGCRHKLLKPDRVLCGPDGSRLPVVGQIDVKLSYKDRETVQTAYVLRNLKLSLLGLPAIRELRFISQVNGVDEQSVKEQYPSLFEGLGTFKRHIINHRGISADPSKTSAIVEMKQPTSLSELRRFMGMVNQLGKFTPHLAELAQPLRELLSTKNAWVWGPSQEEAFQNIKDEMVKPTMLSIYHPDAPTKVSSDASAFGLGAVLLQQQAEERWKPVAYASRFMSETEQRYSQIEKEALGIVWACHKFRDYILGKHICIETDHKPLVPLLGKTSLANLPPRILRFRLRLSRFQYDISHVPGKLLYTADTLSRAPVTQVAKDREDVVMESFLHAIVSSLPANSSKLEEYKQGQEKDRICAQIIRFCQSEWPNKCNISKELQPYWTVRAELSYIDNLLLYRNRIVIPKGLQDITLHKIHQGHQGISKCYERVVTAVWWPGVIKDMEAFIKSCPQCSQRTPLTCEPLLPTTLPNHPWERVAADLCQLKGSVYLVVADYYSRFIEVKQMASTTATKVIEALKSIFSRHGIPEVLISDNGPQFASSEMQEFAAQYRFTHITSSPLYPQSNGLAERSVRTVKGLLQDAEDPYLALLAYRATPLPWCHFSPAELLMGRRIRTEVPQTQEQFKPKWPYLEKFERAEERHKLKQKQNFDKRRRARSLPALEMDTPVWVNFQNHQVPGTVADSADTPRSYHVNIPTGQVRRNRRDLRPRQDCGRDAIESEPEDPPSGIRTRSRTGTSLRPPDRLTYYQ